MNFDKTNKVIVDSMDHTEARAFAKFLTSEIARHERDIKEAKELIRKVGKKFGF